jgi:tetratricopeptide (TPR) repeat protein
MRVFLLIFALSVHSLVADPASDWPQSDSELTPTAMALINEAQREVLRLHFAHARDLCAQAEALAPLHPLPLVMDVGVRLYEIQEGIEANILDPKSYHEFYAKEDALIRLASEREEEFPQSPYPKLHLGAAYGCRGLVKLYQKSYLQSYHDGKRGVEYLQKAVAIDPTQYNAYMGLGQFQYYCARLNGLLQFLLDLQGDEKQGIEKLKLCEAKGTYSAWACRTFLTSILIYDQRDWTTVGPYLDKVFRAFPENYHHVRMVATYAQGSGMENAESRDLMELACSQWDKGWRPPAYVKDFSLEPARLELARYYIKEGKYADARRHLEALDHSEDMGLARSASSLMVKLK